MTTASAGDDKASRSAVSGDVAIAVALGVGMVAGSVLTRFFAKRAAASASAISKAASSSLADRPPYKPGAKPTLPSSTFGKDVRVYDPSVLKSSYSLMISTVTPRPIALVSSRHGTTGVDNVSPFSYFGAVAHDPPMIAIGFCRNGGAKKDSLQNIESNNGQFCVNIISEWYLDAANHSCGNFASSVDEFDVSGMTKINDCEVVNAPRVKEAAVSYECELQHIHALTNDATGKATTEIVLAKVVRVHVDSTVLMANSDVERPAVDTMQLKPVGRLGGNIYSMIGETVDIPRPKVS
uniref:Flavin reductase like domain-containing protein n=2 Tax=Craspedostauros australis TaxID=1486917 RepID=A0A7R9WQM4_9STRA|mmetsp:Transcript_15755/g.43520  ORF Transcript_15755/g.43520 Transcript_15755/m.43520 type:complete len:295 (+) Transcript_15755:101-985(+)|eukprot:CAMPEP_0198112534 /NCGR_PEP_ID=MMETSP1442-20131203/4377_1 /TAXON_ID= /ORGANISM="Craspedostauros australis, Strain CCMP3328" /LENGTH=294 /DNA_ID=CAMNT_0043769345 /DNA_START=33 /DNA_END=917 /DNA_ORIENTATION=+